MTSTGKRENCKANYGGHWGHCIICDGRIHEENCCTKRNPKIDCCPERHAALLERGIICGIYDRSQAMDFNRQTPVGAYSNGYTTPEEQAAFNFEAALATMKEYSNPKLFAD